MSTVYLRIGVTARKERYSNPLGQAEFELQVEADNAANLEFGNILQGTIQVALDNLNKALLEEEQEEEGG